VDAVDATSTGYQDCVGHGTAVAAIIAARNLQAQGVPFEGVAPRARILSVKVTNADTSSPATTGGSNILAQGIIEAAGLGAQVINVSVQTRKNTPARRAPAAPAGAHPERCPAAPAAPAARAWPARARAVTA
jgi:membrane-anchored mycosin MYCP